MWRGAVALFFPAILLLLSFRPSLTFPRDISINYIFIVFFVGFKARFYKKGPQARVYVLVSLDDTLRRASSANSGPSPPPFLFPFLMIYNVILYYIYCVEGLERCFAEGPSVRLSSLLGLSCRESASGEGGRGGVGVAVFRHCQFLRLR